MRQKCEAKKMAFDNKWEKAIHNEMINKEEISLLERIGLTQSSDESIIEERVSEYLQKYGFDENYAVTTEGRICEAILDLLS